jgi:predicted transcriptional regulator
VEGRVERTLVATRLDQSTLAALKLLAKSQDRPLAYIVRRAVQEFVARQQSSRELASISFQ